MGRDHGGQRGEGSDGVLHFVGDMTLVSWYPDQVMLDSSMQTSNKEARRNRLSKTNVAKETTGEE